MEPPCPDSLGVGAALCPAAIRAILDYQTSLESQQTGLRTGLLCWGKLYIACNTALMGGGEEPGMVWCQVFLSYKGNFVVMGNPWSPWHPDKVYKVRFSRGC